MANHTGSRKTTKKRVRGKVAAGVQTMALRPTAEVVEPSTALIGASEEPARKQLTISSKASVSLQMMAEELRTFRGVAAAARSAGLASADMVGRPVAEASAAVLIDTTNTEAVGNRLADAGVTGIDRIAEEFLDVRLPLRLVNAMIADDEVRRISSIKRKALHMERALLEGAVMGSGGRLVNETGRDVRVAIVDSGFDLSHPMFRDQNNNLRVDALLDQEVDRTFTRQQLETGWSNGTNPGADPHGHGTHVATIAAGSPFQGLAGVAPDARLLLVKSDMVRLAAAARWAFTTAGAAPCVVNMSLGHHFGAHDGTDAEERVFGQLAGPGRIIVASAGNERTDNLHIGGRFSLEQRETAVFDLSASRNPPVAPLTLWYDASDRFDVIVVSPTGRRITVPATNGSSTDVDGARVDVARQDYGFNNLIQVQVQVSFDVMPLKLSVLQNWRIEATCRRAAIGRLDGWVANSGFAEFRSGSLVETARTVGLPATSAAAIAVASHVSKNEWKSDAGAQRDTTAVVGRSSDFSSRGPTRDGRNKPEISASGQYLTSALGGGSLMEQQRARAQTAARQLTIEGTSMSAPFVAGSVALVLQRNPQLTPRHVIDLMRRTAVRDGHTGPLEWTPEFGHGKLSVRALLGGLSGSAEPHVAHGGPEGVRTARRRARRA